MRENAIYGKIYAAVNEEMYLVLTGNLMAWWMVGNRILKMCDWKIFAYHFWKFIYLKECIGNTLQYHHYTVSGIHQIPLAYWIRAFLEESCIFFFLVEEQESNVYEKLQICRLELEISCWNSSKYRIKIYKASEDACPRLRPNQREWKYRDGHQRGEIRSMAQKMESFVKTPLTSVNTMSEIDRVNIIPHNNNFSDNGQKAAFSEGQDLANVAQKWVNSEHSTNKCTHQRKWPFSSKFINFFWPLEGQNSANMAKKLFNSEHSPNKCTHQVWIRLCEYFFK